MKSRPIDLQSEMKIGSIYQTYYVQHEIINVRQVRTDTGLANSLHVLSAGGLPYYRPL